MNRRNLHRVLPDCELDRRNSGRQARPDIDWELPRNPGKEFRSVVAELLESPDVS